MSNNHQERIDDPRVLSLVPHRPPMLLIDSVIAVTDDASEARVAITKVVSFYEQGKGVPSWIGMEYMGQTAALIAGYQQQAGNQEPYLGFLMGIRNFEARVPYFVEHAVLRVLCKQIAVLGETLANFQCEIQDSSNGELLAHGVLSVFRKKLPAPDPQKGSVRREPQSK